MNRALFIAMNLTAGIAVTTGASADPIKVGVIAPFSGPFAQYGIQYQQAIEVYQAQHGLQAGEHEIKFIYKDVGGVNPSQSQTLAKELIIRDKVDYLAGFTFTPNALAVAPIIEQSKTPTVIFNAATSAINKESGYFLRTSYTLWQVSAPLAEWAYEQGLRKIATTVSDYGPGIDAEVAFKTTFESKGGEVIDSVRMPLSTTDFTPVLQRVKDKSPDAVFTFLPGGPPTFTYTKTYNENGLREAGIKFLGTAETEETNLQSLGDMAIGLTTAYHYSAAHDSPTNREFLSALAKLHPDAKANWASVGAYDGVHLIYNMVKANPKDGKTAVDSALNTEWESPRGPVTMDSTTRTLSQNIYIRSVERNPESKQLQNTEKGIITTVSDLGW